MIERLTVDVTSPLGGWGSPWPNVAEVEAVLGHEKWTLVGGLMTQFHSIRHDVGTVRPTTDVDMVLHIETTRGVTAETVRALESLGYELKSSADPRDELAHRFIRTHHAGGKKSGTDDIVDVLIADHAAPSVVEKLRGRTMIPIEGGTQALRRTINARLSITPDRVTTISVPSPFGATILKAAAYVSDPRDRKRHLQDAALLLSVIEDPYVERADLGGSDRRRLDVLRRALPDNAREWLLLPEEWRTNGQAALRILTG